MISKLLCGLDIERGCAVEELDFVDPGKRVTKRLAHYIISLCPYLTAKEIAQHLGLDWKTVKAIHKEYFQAKFSQRVDGNSRLLAVDEITSEERASLSFSTGIPVRFSMWEKEEDMKL